VDVSVTRHIVGYKLRNIFLYLALMVTDFISLINYEFYRRHLRQSLGTSHYITEIVKSNYLGRILNEKHRLIMCEHVCWAVLPDNQVHQLYETSTFLTNSKGVPVSIHNAKRTTNSEPEKRVSMTGRA
jgi:hypothetical protein